MVRGTSKATGQVDDAELSAYRKALNCEVSKSVKVVATILANSTPSQIPLDDPKLDILRKLANRCVKLILSDFQCRDLLNIWHNIKTELTFIYRKDDDFQKIKEIYPEIWCILFDRSEGGIPRQVEEMVESDRSQGEEIVIDEASEDDAVEGSEAKVVEAYLFLCFHNWRQGFSLNYFSEFGRPTSLEFVLTTMKKEFKVSFKKHLENIKKSSEDVLSSFLDEEEFFDPDLFKIPGRAAEGWDGWLEGFLDSQHGLKYVDWPNKTTKALVNYWAEGEVSNLKADKLRESEGKTVKKRGGPARAVQTLILTDIPAQVRAAFSQYKGRKPTAGKFVKDGSVQAAFLEWFEEEFPAQGVAIDQIKSWWSLLAKDDLAKAKATGKKRQRKADTKKSKASKAKGSAADDEDEDDDIPTRQRTRKVRRVVSDDDDEDQEEGSGHEKDIEQEEGEADSDYMDTE
ncbi:hypothetical protein TWF694_009926 [Orbilia ellipsospora]|uniref:Uncharacterized protein n=1 Tax=Orbilia ellipsospora TaxID=2528407 RepID=A0AAV9XCB0_9PEZI